MVVSLMLVVHHHHLKYNQQVHLTYPGTYTINITVTDSYSESVTLSNQTITVDQSANNGEVYIYYSNYGTVSDLEIIGSNYLVVVMGMSSVDSSTPPEVTHHFT